MILFAVIYCHGYRRTKHENHLPLHTTVLLGPDSHEAGISLRSNLGWLVASDSKRDVLAATIRPPVYSE